MNEVANGAKDYDEEVDQTKGTFQPSELNNESRMAD